MKFLLTGKNGQVGFEMQRSLAPLGEVVAVDHSMCDLADEDAIRQLVRRVKPDVIVNPAAYTAVDKAESDKHAAFAVNAKAPAILGQEAERLGALVIHFSTDYVFDGTKEGAYSEEDEPHPLNVYGESKWGGERTLAEANPLHLILRTSWVVGAHGSNFAKTMLRLAGEREHLNVVADQFGVPTSAALLADLTAHLISRYQRERCAGFPFGTYHVVADGETNWYEYARFVVAQALASGKTLKADPERIAPISSSDYPTAAKRPSNSRMDTRLFRDTFGLRLPHWQEGLEQILQQIL